MSVLLGKCVDRSCDRAEFVGECGGEACARRAGAVELARPRLVGVPLAREVSLLLEAAQQGVERVGVGVEPARLQLLEQPVAVARAARAAAGTPARPCRAAAPAGACRVLRSRSCFTLYCVSHTIVNHTSMFIECLGLARSARASRKPLPSARRVAERLERWSSSDTTPRTSSSRRASCSTPSAARRTPASTARCARTTSRRGALRQGESGFAWSWLGAALAATSFSLGVVNAPGPAVSPGDHRAGDRDPRGDVPRAVLGGARQRRGDERARHRRPLARRRTTATRGSPRASTSSAACSPASACRTTGTSACTTRASGAARQRRRRCSARRSAPRPRAGSRAGPTASRPWRSPPTRCAGSSTTYRGNGGRGPAVLQVHVSLAPTDAEALAIAKDQWRNGLVSPPRVLGHRAARGVRRGRRASRTTPRCARRCSSRTDAGELAERIADLVAHRLRPRLPPPRRQGPGAVPAAGRGRAAAAPEGGIVKITDTSDLWWKTAVVYCLDVETYMDSDGDGIGDFAGPRAAHRLPRRPRRDVPVADALLSEPRPRRRLRHHRLLRRRSAAGHPRRPRRGDPHREGSRHAGDRRPRRQPHLRPASVVRQRPAQPQRASSATSTCGSTSRRRSRRRSVFPGEESSVWELDEASGQYYLHSFYRHQPDLNIANPRVRDEIAKSIGFWLELGISGFRVDAVPFLIEAPPGVEIGDPHEYLRDLRRFLRAPQQRGRAPRRGEPAVRPAGRVLRRRRRRRAHHAVRLHLDAGALPLARALRSRARSSGPHGPARDRPGVAVRELRAQPRRAHARQADGCRARGGLRGLRTRRAAARLRPRHHPAHPADARRRSAPDPHGLQPAVLAAGHARPLLRRGDRDGREPRDRGTAVGAHADAVERGAQRRLLVAPHRRAWSRRPRRTATRRSTSTSTPSCSDDESLLQFVQRLAVRYRSSPEIGWGRFEVLEQEQPAVLAHSIVGGRRALRRAAQLLGRPGRDDDHADG